jgi:hypothetical protein
MAEDMIERAMNALRKHSYPKPYPDEMARALAAALDPEDEVLVSAIAQRLADDATVARNELRLIRQGIDLSSAEPVSPSIFKKDARVMIATLKAIAQGDTKP